MEGRDGGIIQAGVEEELGEAGRVHSTAAMDRRRYRRRHKWFGIATRRKTPPGTTSGLLGGPASIIPHLVLPIPLWNGLLPHHPFPTNRPVAATTLNPHPTLIPPVTILPLRERSGPCLPKRCYGCSVRGQVQVAELTALPAVRRPQHIIPIPMEQHILTHTSYIRIPRTT